MKKSLIAALMAAFCLSVMSADSNPKYVLLFIGDGMSIPQRTIAEEFSKESGRGPLMINSLPKQALTRTCSANSLITDSAAAATAIACGEKTNNGVLGISADGQRRLESCAEIAHKDGKKVGLVTSVTINHATPGGFYAHQPSRGLMYRIGLDLIASNFEYFGGGGFSGQHNKTDDEQYKGDLFELAKEAGYTVVRTREALNALPATTPKALALYGDGALPFAVEAGPEVPTLAEFTAKGIEILQNDAPKGFFMMVEGGAIDYRGHANDAGANIKEVLAFDDAVKVGMAFYEQHPEETLLLVTGDHETGGMTMGFANAGYGLNLLLLDKQKCIPETLNALVKAAKDANPNYSFEDAKALLTEKFGFVFDEAQKDDKLYVSGKDLEDLKAAYDKGELGGAARLLLQNRAGIGWSSGNHTALPVLTTSVGVASERFTGFLENTDLAKLLKSLL